MAKKILRFKKLVSRRTLGRLGGTTLAAITLGMLTPPVVIDVPVEVVRGGALPEQDKLYLAIPRHYYHEGKLDLELIVESKTRLITSEEHYETLKDLTPLTIDRVVPTEYSVLLEDEQGGQVEITGVTKENEEEVIVLVLSLILDEEA
ncbi:MAG: hypothetical protein ABW140_10750 [Candidatus Sedimenticola sp. 6PFRAG1]